MSQIKNFGFSILVSKLFITTSGVLLILGFFGQKVLAQGSSSAGTGAVQSDALHLRSLEGMFTQLLMAAWSLSIIYFTAQVLIIGYQYMFSFGDSNKSAELADKGKRLVVGIIIVFSSWVLIFTILSVLNLETADDSCFSGNLQTIRPVFKFFFPNACN